MAISPQSLEEGFQKEVKTYEEYFDKFLSNKKITRGESVSINIPMGFNQLHFAILKTRYHNAGWSEVKWNSDQREGDWLTFKY